MMYTVYMHTTPNNKVYVGITCNSLNKRWKYGKGYTKCPLFYNAIKKYGWNNIKHEVLYENLTEEDAKRIEQEEIAKRKSNDRQFGYNITAGGDGASGYKHSEKAKAKMREHHYDCSGKNNPMYGTKMSEEHKQMLISLHKGKHLSKETKAKMSKSRKGKPAPIYAFKSGKENYSYGKKGKLSAVAKRVIQLSYDGTEIIKVWDCIADACRKYNLKSQSINKSLHKGCRAGGFYWKYADKE